MSDEITKRKERLNLPHNLKERYEKSGLACTYEEWLEDAVRELVMSTQTRWDRITELEQENARLREAAESLLDSVRPRFDLQHNKIVPDLYLDKLREALEAGDE